MKNFNNKLAVITGAGTGMGRELARALAREGADLALCDVIDANMAETLALCEAEAAQGRPAVAPTEMGRGTWHQERGRVGGRWSQTDRAARAAGPP